MTDQTTPPVTLDIEVDEVHDKQTIVTWRGTKGHDGRVEFAVYNAVAAMHEGRQVLRRGDLVFGGLMESSGCIDIQTGAMHLCSFPDLQHVMQLLGHVYVRGFELMGIEPSRTVDPEGYAVFQLAKQAREAERVQALIDKSVAELRHGGISTIGVKA